jgi:hypothetical protein
VASRRALQAVSECQAVGTEVISTLTKDLLLVSSKVDRLDASSLLERGGGCLLGGLQRWSAGRVNGRDKCPLLNAWSAQLLQ